MKNTKQILKQQKHQGIQINDGASAVLSYKPTKMGRIINMSRDGLAVRYTSMGAQLSETSELDIFIIDSHFYIGKMQVRTTSDFELTDKHPFGSKKIRQRCFQFRELKPCQLFQLDYFLENYTIKIYSDKNHSQIAAYQDNDSARDYSGSDQAGYVFHPGLDRFETIRRSLFNGL